MNEEAKALARDVLIKPFEGLARLLPDGNVTSYPDPGTKGNPWTIGYGSTGPDIQPGTIWTMKQCEDALDHHIEYFYAGVCKLSPAFPSASPRRIAATVSWAYNCGLGNYRISTFKKRIVTGKHLRSEEHTLNSSHSRASRMPSSA